MDRLPFRQVHLDFHTSECMPDVGSQFSEENFEKALKLGHINSITLFSKCHHGWSYHPTKVNVMHPTLDTNLLDRQLKVCQKLGVRTQIYISAGLDERKAYEFPQFLVSVKGLENDLTQARFHQVCLNNDEYLEMLSAEVAEVMEMFAGRSDGVFLDICFPPPCVCSYCVNDMLSIGLNPENDEDVKKHARMTYDKFTAKIRNTVAKYDPEMPVFFNCGNIPRNDRSFIFANNKHLELESLPTGGWGYDHFPLSAAYARNLNREFSGMTGKFHKTWGEFGGFKHPNALIYETSLSLAMGAKCCIGDQLHPLGKFEESTYKLMGEAYELVEKKETYCHDVTPISDGAIYTTYIGAEEENCPDKGANRMLLEGKYLFDVIDDEVPFDRYKFIIFPDRVTFTSELSERVNRYLAGGGKILLTGTSGLTEIGAFFKDFGIEYRGKNELKDNYFVPTYDFSPNGIAPYLMYENGQNIAVTGKVEIWGEMEVSYFNRSTRRFCSHSTTPNEPGNRTPAVVKCGNIGYIAWNVFQQYGEHGAYHLKALTLDLLEKLIGEQKTITTNLPSNGIITLMDQKEEHRLVNHLLYAVTKIRGNNTEIIEDAIPICNTEITLRMDCPPKAVYMAPEKKEIPFTYANGILKYKIDQFTIHTLVVIEY